MTINDSFAPLFNKYKQEIYQLCLSILHDQALAEDITQETFLAAYKHLGELREKKAFRAWLYKIAKNLSFSTLRKSKNLSLIEESVAEFKENIPSTHEEIELLFELLPKLSPQERAVFELYEIQRNSHKEVAKLLHIPEGTSRSRLWRAKKKLKSLLQERGINFQVP